MADELLSRRVEVTFVGRPPARQIAAAVGVSDVEVVERRVRCVVRGSFQPLLEALRGYEVIGFTSIPTPEEVVDGCKVSLFGRPDHLNVPPLASRQLLILSDEENDMTITPATLFRASGVAATLAGLIFVGVQINHPRLDATSITTGDVIARNLLKLCMAALALAGLTGMYLRQVTKIGFLGLLGYVLFAAGFLSIFGTEFVAAFILPTLAHSAPAYASDLIAAANNGTAIGDIGLMQTVILMTAIGYLGGGFIFGIALFRANVLARWAAALLAVGTLATIGTSIMPQYERLFAIPTGLALIGLGYSLWSLHRTPSAQPVAGAVSSKLEPAGAR